VGIHLQRLLQRSHKRRELARHSGLVSRDLIPAALSHFLTVLRDKPVRFGISLIESWSRNFMRLTLPTMSMVITLVNFESALPCLGRQFSVGGNIPCC